MTSDEVIARVRARGGELRVGRSGVQYRPAGVLTAAELRWLADHRDDVVAALAGPDSGNTWPVQHCSRARFDGDPVLLGEAGPGVPAWHWSIDRGSVHLQSARIGDSCSCATCHPATLSLRGRLQ